MNEPLDKGIKRSSELPSVIGKELKLPQEAIAVLVEKEASKVLILFLVIFGVISLLIVATGMPNVPQFLSFFALMAVVMGSLIYFLRKNGARNQLRAARYILDYDAIEMYQDRMDLSAWVKMSQGINEAKYGSQFNCCIYFDSIAKIEQKKNYLVVYSKTYNPLNAAGKIMIPVALVEFEKLKEELFELSPELKSKYYY